MRSFTYLRGCLFPFSDNETCELSRDVDRGSSLQKWLEEYGYMQNLPHAIDTFTVNTQVLSARLWMRSSHKLQILHIRALRAPAP